MSNVKILIVDDEPEIVRALGLLLRANGYETVSALDGVQATQLAMKEQPDLILLDICMPGGDGHVVAQRLRESSKSLAIPIIMLTARTSKDDYDKAHAEGVVKYITKPYKPETLLAVIKDALGQRSPTT
ncbi:MAG: response regulator [candidate division Zixibacteria bacterium]|nr:response regulator [candidate division Zixibacteria bacterium]